MEGGTCPLRNSHADFFSKQVQNLLHSIEFSACFFFGGGVGSSNFASDPIILSGVPPQQIPGYAPELVHRNFTSYCGGSRQEQLTMI